MKCNDGTRKNPQNAKPTNKQRATTVNTQQDTRGPEVSAAWPDNGNDWLDTEVHDYMVLGTSLFANSVCSYCVLLGEWISGRSCRFCFVTSVVKR